MKLPQLEVSRLYIIIHENVIRTFYRHNQTSTFVLFSFLVASDAIFMTCVLQIQTETPNKECN